MGGAFCVFLKLISGICIFLESILDVLDFIGLGFNVLYEIIKNVFYFNIIKKWYLIGLNDVSKIVVVMVVEIVFYFFFYSYIIYISFFFFIKWIFFFLF